MANGQDDGEETVIYHPNRQKATSKATKAAVTLLLLVTAGLVLIVTIGGWANLEGAQIVSILYILIFCLMAYYVARWNRGVLPLAAGLSIVLLVFAAIAAPGWFDRDATGYAESLLPAGLVGLLVVVLIPVCVLLIAFAMRGFSQSWNTEIEMTRGEYEKRMREDQRGGGSGGRGGVPQTQG